MILGIDASNIRTGGGLTHLKSILQNIDEQNLKFNKVIVWSNKQTLNHLPEKSWLVKKTHAYLNKSNIWAFIFQFFILNTVAKNENCSIIFAPGSTFISNFKPFVTLSQNMLPFENKESMHYGLLMRMRLKILFFTQTYTFKKSSGLIFLTNYAKNYISNKINLKNKNTINIAHGIHLNFKLNPRNQEPVFSQNNPFKLLYVSYITVYKHQWHLAEAICQLNNEGYHINLTLIGPILDSYDKLKTVINNNANANQCISYLGKVEHDNLAKNYHQADAFVFASSCENMPIILIEAMSAGLPIASSNLGPMPEVLEDAGLYFDPRNVSQIKEAILKLYNNALLREQLANKAYNKVKNYTWENCAENTFNFLYKIALKNK